MSENNVETKKPVQPTGEQPVKYTFRPVHLETPVDVIQRFNYASSAYQQFQDQIPLNNGYETTGVETVPTVVQEYKCGIRKVQNFFFVLAVLAILAIFVGFIGIPSIAEIVNQVLSANTTVQLVDWKLGNYIYAIVPFVVLSFLISIIIRWLFHPITCKAKKGRHCCFGCEFLKYVWTVLFVGIFGAVALVYTKTLGFDKILNSAINVVNTVISGGTINDKQVYTLYCIGLSIFVIISLVSITLVHHSKDRQRAIYEVDTSDVVPSDENVNNNLPVIDNLSNPNNPYATEVYEKKSGFGRFLLILLVIAAAVVVVTFILGLGK